MIRAFLHSVAAKTAIVVIVFFAVPLLLYQQFQDADQDKRKLLLSSLENQGMVIGESLRPQLKEYDGEALRGIGQALKRLGGVDGLKIKLLLRPSNADDPSGFFYIASAPAVSGEYLEQERAELVETGVFEKLQDTCAGNRPLGVRYRNPAGEEEVLTPVTPVMTDAGCWAVITSHGTNAALGAALGNPYWQTPEVQAAFFIYVIMAVLVILMFVGIWRALRRFARAARMIRVQGISEGGAQFTEINRVPELEGVAAEFDRMVATLRNAAHAIRHAAEDNAHAFKTPIATIAQSVEPLRRMAAEQNPRAQRSIELIERSLDRLDALVAASRRMDEATAELMEAPRERVDLPRFVGSTLDGYTDTAAAKGVRLERKLANRVEVLASEDMLETVLENLLDNAIDFSPEGGKIEVAVRREQNDALLSVTDAGPGVEADRIQQIFERYVSSRASQPNGGDAPASGGNGEDQPMTQAQEDAESARIAQSPTAGSQHFGIGLWLVRRNVEAMGGEIQAENASPHGLRITARLPLSG
ncbi:sensor histidine kinase [Rhodovibrio salinarum]|uniref:sensor histidine kinase n=1 Tax=Rhodovibrio salinarum TaxID=1087 RepID=UPI00048A0F74|nr:HAMP domain-containing sensor histidine kinase [Rhodovibrio salinarum]